MTRHPLSPEARDLIALMHMRFWTIANLWRTDNLDREIALQLQRQLHMLAEYTRQGLHQGAEQVACDLMGILPLPYSDPTED